MCLCLHTKKNQKAQKYHQRPFLGIIYYDDLLFLLFAQLYFPVFLIKHLLFIIGKKIINFLKILIFD